MKITVIGTGYVGLVTGTCFAELGNDVVCMDIDQGKIDKLKSNIMPIFEPGLEELVKRNQTEGRLEFTTNMEHAISASTIIFNAVGTPPDQDHKADLQFVKQAAEDFGRHLSGYKIIVNKSTVPVGTAELVRSIINKVKSPQAEFDVVSNPEFLREGSAISDTFKPDRIVIGIDSERAQKLMAEIYEPFAKKDVPMLFTTIRNAEIIKYAANSFLATKISYINELANYCDKVGTDVDINDIAKGMGLDHRIGKHFLNAGIGYGGSCFPKDIKALIESGKQVGYNFKLIQTVDEVNEAQKKITINKLRQHLPGLRGKLIAIWGLSFKPNTDDMRDAPSIEVIYELTKLGASVQGFDPEASENAKRIFGSLKNVSIMANPYDALKDAHALLLLTEWDEFKSPDLERMRRKMKGDIIIDGRNIWNSQTCSEAGFKYSSIGR